MATDSQTPAFVLVPGGFCPATVFDPLAVLLEQAGHKASKVSLPSTNQSLSPPASLADDAAEVQRQVRAFADAGCPVVLVGNSYGGWLLNEATPGLSKKERAMQGLPGGLVHMLYLASAIPATTGISVHEIFAKRGGGAPAGVPTGDSGFLDPPPAIPAGKVLVGSLPPEEQAKWGESLVKSSARVFNDKLTHLGWQDVGTTAVITLKDAIVDVSWQRAAVEEALASGSAKAGLRAVDIEGDHCCMISQPEETARICLEAAKLAMAED